MSEAENHMQPLESVPELPHLDEMTPREIVRELDKFVIGQNAAKRAVAIALRNRIRRQKLTPEMQAVIGRFREWIARQGGAD